MADNADDAPSWPPPWTWPTRSGLRTVAEGVSDEQTDRALTELGCDLSQGWPFGGPVPAHELTIAPTEPSLSDLRA